MKPITNYTIQESQSTEWWLLSNGMFIPANNALLKYDDEEVIWIDKWMNTLDQKDGFDELFIKPWNGTKNIFSGVLYIKWRGTIDEYRKKFYTEPFRK